MKCIPRIKRRCAWARIKSTSNASSPKSQAKNPVITTETAVEANIGSKRCIYCDKYKQNSEFSLEHIFPDSMGGKLCPDLFKTRDVCRKCNSTMGLFVDGPVIKSWFGKNAESQAYRDFIDPKNPQSLIPFSYIGIEQNFHFQEGEICELWLGPYGEHIYHAHKADDPRYDSYAGGSPISRRSEPGRAYLFFTHPDLEKINLTIRSFAHQFKKANRYAGNFKINGQSGLVLSLPSDLIDEHARLVEFASSGRGWNARVAFQIGFEERFLAKLARGMGYQLFGSDYLDTPYGATMQRALWEQDRSVRGKLIRGVPMLSDIPQSVREHTGLPGTYSILLWAIADIFALILTLPDGKILSVVISDQPTLWSDAAFDSYKEGVIFIIAPQVQSCVGPLLFPEFLAHTLGGHPLQPITLLENKRVPRSA